MLRCRHCRKFLPAYDRVCLHCHADNTVERGQRASARMLMAVVTAFGFAAGLTYGGFTGGAAGSMWSGIVGAVIGIVVGIIIGQIAVPTYYRRYSNRQRIE